MHDITAYFCTEITFIFNKISDARNKRIFDGTVGKETVRLGFAELFRKGNVVFLGHVAHFLQLVHVHRDRIV